MSATTTQSPVRGQISLRSGSPADAAVCGEICYRAFNTISEHHKFPPDFPDVEQAIGLLEMCLSHPRVYSVVAESDGRIVGSNFLWELSPIAGVGPITVDPASQNSSVGRKLMDAVLQRAAEQKFPGVRLVQAGYHCRSLSLYAKLGFDVREPLACMNGQPLRVRVPGRTVRPATAGDVDACAQLCSRVHGHDRSGELMLGISQSTARVVEHDGRITGYASLIGFFGHAVGETNDDLQAMIGAAEGFAGPGMLVPMRNAELLRWCLSHGLRMVQPLTLMSLGLYTEPRGAFLPSILF